MVYLDLFKVLHVLGFHILNLILQLVDLLERRAAAVSEQRKDQAEG